MCGGFFFFKQKTAYEMRISDWSSDVCSSDLSRPRAAGAGCGAGARLPDHPGAHPLSQLQLHRHQPPDRHQLRLPRSADPLLMSLAKSTGEDALETAPREVSTFGLAWGNSGVLGGGGLLLSMVLLAPFAPYLAADPLAHTPIDLQ